MIDDSTQTNPNGGSTSILEGKPFDLRRLTRWMLVVFACYTAILVVPSWTAGDIGYGAAVALGTSLATTLLVSFRAMFAYGLWSLADANRTLANMTQFGVLYAIFLFVMATGIPTTMKMAGLTMPLKGICATMFIASPAHGIVIFAVAAFFPIWHLLRQRAVQPSPQPNIA